MSQPNSTNRSVASNSARYPIFNGQRDTRSRTQQPYNAVTFDQILSSIQNPTCRPKDKAPAVMATTCLHPDARRMAHLSEHGRFSLIAMDIDEGNHPLEDVHSAVAGEFGDVEYLIYSSSSAASDKRKWRVLIETADDRDAEEHRNAQSAVIEAMGARGIKCDAALRTPNQPIFLPNVPDERRNAGVPIFYQWHVNHGPKLQRLPQPITARMAAFELEAYVREEQAKKRLKERAKRLQDGTLTPIEWFNQNHSLVDLMLKHGFEPRGGNWFASPFSTSKGRSVHVFGDCAISYSGSDVGKLGIETESGRALFDAFSVFKHFECGDSRDKALDYCEEQMLMAAFDEVSL